MDAGAGKQRGITRVIVIEHRRDGEELGELARLPGKGADGQPAAIVDDAEEGPPTVDTAAYGHLVLRDLRVHDVLGAESRADTVSRDGHGRRRRSLAHGLRVPVRRTDDLGDGFAEFAHRIYHRANSGIKEIAQLGIRDPRFRVERRTQVSKEITALRDGRVGNGHHAARVHVVDGLRQIPGQPRLDTRVKRAFDEEYLAPLTRHADENIELGQAESNLRLVRVSREVVNELVDDVYDALEG